MSAKTVMTIVGVISIIEGIAFYVGAEQITRGAFSLLTGNALEVGTIMHEAMASAMVAIGVLILFLRDNTGVAAKKSLQGIAGANSIFLIGGLIHLVNSPAKPPLPALGLLVVFIAACLVSAQKVKVD